MHAGLDNVEHDFQIPVEVNSRNQTTSAFWKLQRMRSSITLQEQ